MRTSAKSALGRKKEQAEFKKNQSEPELMQQNLDKKLVASLKPKGLPYWKQMRYVSRVLSKKEKGIINFLIFLIILSMSYWGYTFYSKNIQVVPVQGGEYSEALIGAPRFINPLLAQTNDVDMDLVKLIYSGLLTYNKKLELVGDLAENYTVSEDQKIYTFTLKKDVVWHDGELLSANDIVFTFQSAQDPQYKSPLFYSLRGVKIEKKDDSAIVFTLNEAYPQFLEILTMGILPEHIWKDIPAITANLTEYNMKPIGSGQWKYESFMRDKFGNIKSYTIAPNASHYSAKPFLKKITFKFFPDYDPITDIHPAIEALNNRKVDGVSYIPKNLKNKMQNPKINFYSLVLPQYTALFFNQKTNDLLKEKYMREAIAAAIDKTGILTEALNLEGTIVHSPILEGYPGFDKNIKALEYDPEKAMKLLSDNGWKELTKEQYNSTFTIALASSSPTMTDEIIPQINENPATAREQTMFREKNKRLLKIKLTAPDISENIQAAELIKKYLQNIGIMVDLEIIDNTKIIREVIRPRSYEMLLFGEIIGLDPDPYPFWHSSQNQDPGLNLAIFTNRNIDKTLEDARKAKTPEEKITKYTEFQNLIVSDIPAVFLYSPTYTYALHNKIKGVGIERIILPSDRFNNVSEWYIDTGKIWK